MEQTLSVKFLTLTSKCDLDLGGSNFNILYGAKLF